MRRKLHRAWLAVLALAAVCPLLAPVAVGAGDAVVRSGFLGNAAVYALLQPVQIPDGATAERWFGPQMSTGYYASVLVDEVMFYPEPKADPRVGAGTLQQVRGYLGTRLREAIGELLPLATSTGPHVLRMQAAITGVGAGTPAGPAHPLATLFGGTRAAHVFVEVRFHDGETGELVGIALREVKGEPVDAGAGSLQLEHVRASLDQAADAAAATLAMTLTGPPGGH